MNWVKISKGTPNVRWWIGVSGFALIFSLLMGYEAFYEMFIWVEGVHYPNVRFGNGQGDTSTFLHFSLDVPTVCWAIILVSAGTCVAFSTSCLLNLRSQNTALSRAKKYLIVFLLIAQIAAYLVALDDLLSSVGSFG